MHIHIAMNKVFNALFSIFDCHEGFAFNFFGATVNFRARKKKRNACVRPTREREGTKGTCIACEM